MNKQVLDIIKSYSQDNDFEENLTNLIYSLETMLKTIEIENIKLKNEALYEYCKCTFNNTIKKILKKLFINNIETDESDVYWSNGHDDANHLDVTEKKIIFELNEHTIIVNIHYEERHNYVINADIEIDDWLDFIMLDHDGEIGYYENSPRPRFITFDEDKAKLFFKEFDTENIYDNDEKTFYCHLFETIFISITDYFKADFDIPNFYDCIF